MKLSEMWQKVLDWETTNFPSDAWANGICLTVAYVYDNGDEEDDPEAYRACIDDLRAAFPSEDYDNYFECWEDPSSKDGQAQRNDWVVNRIKQLQDEDK